jgi:hypothetical protein
MPAYEIQDFKNGMDLRKLYATAPAGSLRMLRNAVITAGAEIEKRAAFVLWKNAPADSLGLLSRDGMTYVIKDGAAGIVVPANQSILGTITIPFGGRPYDYVADWDLFDGDFYIVMHNPTADTYHHYFRQILVADAAAKASSIRTYRSKVYGCDKRLLRFTAINDPTKWTAPTTGPGDGSGYIDLSSQDADSTNLIGMEAYNNQMAIFSELSTQFWNLDPDPANNSFQQLLRQTGLVAGNALTQFGSGDVMYLSPYGLRSLRVQNISLTAGTTDLGSPIDLPMRELIRVQNDTWFRPARAHIQPRTGRLWLVLKDRIYVLSTFQEPAITAWSQFDPGFIISDSCIADPYVMVRSDDDVIYRYGGDSLAVYDNCQAEVILPALSLDKPSDMKTILGFDIACTGTWQVYAALDPTNEAAEELVATIVNSTFLNGEMRMPGISTHISIRLRSTDLTNATVGKILIHFLEGADD